MKYEINNKKINDLENTIYLHSRSQYLLTKIPINMEAVLGEEDTWLIDDVNDGHHHRI